MDRATDVLLDDLRKSVFRSMDVIADPGGSGRDASYNAEVEIEKPRLANLLPGLARWSHTALNTVPNELVDVRCTFHFLCD